MHAYINIIKCNMPTYVCVHLNAYNICTYICTYKWCNNLCC